MKLRNFVFLFLVFSTLNSCNSQKGGESKPELSAAEEEALFPRGAYPVPIIEIITVAEEEEKKAELGEEYVRVYTKFTPQIIKSWNKTADDHRKALTKSENNKSYSTIDHGIWLYQMAFRGYMRDPAWLLGRWLDFKDDLTYEYGKYGITTGSGKYIYAIDENLLVMVDDNTAVKPVEYSVQRSDDDMVLHGTATYEDHRLSVKFLKSMTLPIEPIANVPQE